MKCCLCEQRKAKRHCPAKNTLICPQCCGEKRVLEISCPETCEFLSAGRERDIQEFERHMRNLDPAARERSRRVLLENQDTVAYLEYTIAQERLLSRDLTDSDVAQAIDVLLETYRTEEKGVLYEKQSDSLRVESLRRELRSVLESLRNPEREANEGVVDPQNKRLKLSAAIDCLEYIRSLVAAFREDRHAAVPYVDFLPRITPRKEMRSSIILP